MLARSAKGRYVFSAAPLDIIVTFTFQLFMRRLAAANQNPELRQHISTLELLGVNGMSSDEEDQYRGTKQYRVFRKVWRAEEITPWLRVFDAAHRRARLEPMESGAGAVPRVRFVTNTVPPWPLRKVVKRLPKSAYHQDWLKSLTERERRCLRVAEDPAESLFTHEPSALL